MIRASFSLWIRANSSPRAAISSRFFCRVASATFSFSALETDENGMIDVADLSALVGELVEKELRLSEIYDDDDHDAVFELEEEAPKSGAGEEDSKAASERREGQP